MPSTIKMIGTNTQKIIFWLAILCLAQLCATNQSFGNKETQVASLEKKNILVLNSYHEGYKWTDSIMRGLRDRLAKSSLAINLYVEYLDTKRFPDRTYWRPLSNSLSTKYQTTPFDLIITTDNNALEFLFQHRDRFYPETPVVFCGLNNFKPEMIENQRNVTGIAEATDLKQTIDLALHLHPNTKKIIFIASSAKSSVLNLEQLEELRPTLKSHLAIEVWKDHTIEENEKKSQQLKANALLFIIGRSRNLKGKYLNTVQMGQRVSAASPVPIYSLWNFYIGTGIVGGKLVNGRDQGRVAGDLALKVLNGIPVDEIPVITETPTSYMFDYLQLKRFNIAMDVLPDNSIVINKPYSFYEASKKIVWATFFVFAMLISLIIALSLNILRRQRAEKELQKHRDHLEDLVKGRTVELSAANKALKESDERLTLTLSGTNAGTWVHDFEREKLFFDAEAQEIFGIKQAECSLEDWQALVHPDDLSPILAHIEKSLQAQAERIEVEYRVCRLDGQKYHLLAKSYGCGSFPTTQKRFDTR